MVEQNPLRHDCARFWENRIECPAHLLREGSLEFPDHERPREVSTKDVISRRSANLADLFVLIHSMESVRQAIQRMRGLSRQGAEPSKPIIPFPVTQPKKEERVAALQRSVQSRRGEMYTLLNVVAVLNALKSMPWITSMPRNMMASQLENVLGSRLGRLSSGIERSGTGFSGRGSVGVGSGPIGRGGFHINDARRMAEITGLPLKRKFHDAIQNSGGLFAGFDDPGLV